MNILENAFKKWKIKISGLFFQEIYIRSLFLGAALLGASIFFSLYASGKNDILFSSTPVEDLFFSVVPLLDLSWVFVVLEMVLIIMALFYGVFVAPQKLPFSLLAFSLFIFLRAICISLTHIGVPVDYIHPTMGTGDFFFHNDLFFSGHTGGPFLVALILWGKKIWRYTLVCVSLLMAFTVLAMRLHYSIDIVGAYFITYGIFKMTENLVHKYPNFLYYPDK